MIRTTGPDFSLPVQKRKRRWWWRREGRRKRKRLSLLVGIYVHELLKLAQLQPHCSHICVSEHIGSLETRKEPPPEHRGRDSDVLPPWVEVADVVGRVCPATTEAAKSGVNSRGVL